MTITPSAALMDAIVLSVVARDGTYGYKITQDIRAVMEISESTLYPVLRRLQKDGCLDVYDQEFAGRNRRYYRITQQGQAQLAEALGEWERYKGRLDAIFYSGASSNGGKV
jgi:PadR family transcriptional regulator PadR